MRTNKSIKNIIIGLATQILNTVLPFISRTIFINVLGSTYLGISGLFTSILTSLSIVELGLASAISYALYKPLAEREEETVAALMKIYGKTYRFIGLLIFVIGMLLIPFLDLFIKEELSIENIELMYVLVLVNTSISYLYSFKRTLFVSDQRNYVSVLNTTFFNTMKHFFQILLLVTLKIIVNDSNIFLIYLTSTIIFTWVSDFSISRKADRMYPYINTKPTKELEKDTKAELLENIKAMFVHKVGGVIVKATDNIFLSSFISISAVALYSNYNMIIGVINGFLSHIFSALTSGIGNLNATENEESSYRVFSYIMFLCFWIYSFSSISLFIMFNPFIKLWIGKDYLLQPSVVMSIVLIFYLIGMGRPALIYRDTLGLFKFIKFKPVVEVIINIIASLILINKYNINGVFWGTIISFLSTSFWIEPYIVYRKKFVSHGLKKYFIKTSKYYIITILIGYLTFKISQLVTVSDNISFMKLTLIVIFVPNLILVLLFHKTSEFKYFKDKIFAHFLQNKRKC